MIISELLHLYNSYIYNYLYFFFIQFGLKHLIYLFLFYLLLFSSIFLPSKIKLNVSLCVYICFYFNFIHIFPPFILPLNFLGCKRYNEISLRLLCKNSWTQNVTFIVILFRLIFNKKEIIKNEIIKNEILNHFLDKPDLYHILYIYKNIKTPKLFPNILKTVLLQTLVIILEHKQNCINNNIFNIMARKNSHEDLSNKISDALSTSRKIKAELARKIKNAQSQPNKTSNHSAFVALQKVLDSSNFTMTITQRILIRFSK